MKSKISNATANLRAILVIVLIICGLGLFPTASPVRASATPTQANGLTMKATAAFSGNFKYGEWLPVMIELTNQGGDLDGEIRIQVAASQGTLVFQAPVALPSGAHKIVPVYVLPNNFSRELDIRLVSQGKDVLTQKATVHPQPNISYFIGLLAPERGALSLMSGITFPRQDRPKVIVDLGLAELPERPEGLRSFDILVVNDTDTSKLTPDQSAALAAWVQQGGRLIVGGGANALQTVAGLPAAMLPMRVQGTGEVKQEALKPLSVFAGNTPIVQTGPFIAAKGEPKESKTLAGDSALPLIQERNWGAGYVDFVAFDLAGVPFNGWPGTQAFWETLLGPSSAFPENMPFDVSPRQFRANSLNYALSNIPSLDLPSIKGLSILLVIYILIVGPVNYLVLRWRKRLHLAWVTMPVITALFTAGAFGIGYTMRGNDLILNKVALVEAKTDGNAAVTSYMGLFSPRMQSYEITIQGENLISPMNYDQGPWGPSGAPGGSGQMTFFQGRPSTVKGLTVNQWAMQSFMAEGVWNDFGKITGDLRLENEKLVGKVRNESKYALTDAVLTFQSRFVRLGSFDPGQEKDIDLGLSNMQSDRFGPPLSYRLYQENNANGPLPRALEIKSNIISSVFENNSMTKMLSSVMPTNSGLSNGILVFGWLNQAPPTVDVPNNRLSQTTTALVYTALDYTLPTTGNLALPTGLIPGKAIKMPPDGGNCSSNTSIHMSRGQAEFEFQVPGNFKDFSVDTLKVAIWNDSGNPVAVKTPGFALYNWQDQSWVSIKDPIQGTNVIQKAGPYVNENGAVRAQISSEGDTIGCIYLDLGIEAHRVSGQGG